MWDTHKQRDNVIWCVINKVIIGRVIFSIINQVNYYTKRLVSSSSNHTLCVTVFHGLVKVIAFVSSDKGEKSHM